MMGKKHNTGTLRLRPDYEALNLPSAQIHFLRQWDVQTELLDLFSEEGVWSLRICGNMSQVTIFVILTGNLHPEQERFLSETMLQIRKEDSCL